MLFYHHCNTAIVQRFSLYPGDNVYLVGYPTQTKKAGRDGVWNTTQHNKTGRRIHFFDVPVNGYTSLLQEADNLYILFKGQGGMCFQ